MYDSHVHSSLHVHCSITVGQIIDMTIIKQVRTAICTNKIEPIKCVAKSCIILTVYIIKTLYRIDNSY